MKETIKNIGILGLICISIFVFSSCETIKIPTNISKLKNNSSKYLGKEVVVEGIVKDHIVDIPELTEKGWNASFILNDKTDTIKVLDTGNPPIIGDNIAVKGIVKRMILNQSEELVLEKKATVPSFMPDTFDWVITIVIFIIGFMMIYWWFNVMVFRCALAVNGDANGAKNLSNVLSLVILLVFILLVALFLFRGLSNIPIYILLTFGFVMLLSILIIYAATVARKA